MKKLIVNADDFGLTKGINKGTILAHENGVVTSTTLMVNGYATDEAFALAKGNPNLSVGIHFVLTFGRPILDGHKSLVDENGDFLKVNVLRESELDATEVEAEFRAQLDKFMSYGLRPTHIDSHHHVHEHDDVFPVVAELAKELNIPMRSVIDKSHGIKCPDLFTIEFYGETANLEGFKRATEFTSDDQLIEVMTHPAVVDDLLGEISSYVSERGEELNVLTSNEIKDYLQKAQVKLINYRNL